MPMIQGDGARRLRCAAALSGSAEAVPDEVLNDPTYMIRAAFVPVRRRAGLKFTTAMHAQACRSLGVRPPNGRYRGQRTCSDKRPHFAVEIGSGCDRVQQQHRHVVRMRPVRRGRRLAEAQSPDQPAGSAKRPGSGLCAMATR